MRKKISLWKSFITVLCCVLIVAYYPLIAANQKASDQAVATGELIPAGTIMAYAGTTAPAGWVFAYGQEVSRTGIYSKLFAAISTTYCTVNHGTASEAGAGGDLSVCDPAKFRIPDMRGRVIAGKDNMGGNAKSRITSIINGTILGNGGGTETQASNVAVTNQPNFANHSDIDIAHGHSFTQPTAHGTIDIDHGHGFTQPTAHGTIDIDHGHSFTQPYFPGHYHGHDLNITSSGATTASGNTANDASHSHTISDPQHSHSVVQTTSGPGSYFTISGAQNAPSVSAFAYSSPNSTGISINTSGAHSHSISSLTVASHTHANGNFSGTIGLASGSGGCNGNLGNTCQGTGGAVVALDASPISLSNNHSGGAVTSLDASPISLTNNHSGGAVTSLGTTNKSISAHSISQNVTLSNGVVSNLAPTTIINYIIKL